VCTKQKVSAYAPGMNGGGIEIVPRLG